ncbi:hypothetical protein EV182_002862 [Spiromyces aspiralis]|uniref:Uncharacterized protein n=1 Tax=Spiromyces aspiralis TaxID=68401 RepID=A0ACC1HDK9_9FUNG|nr:hypothetical protein EV182_002862 [Spiromyces aspiralis]
MQARAQGSTPGPEVTASAEAQGPGGPPSEQPGPLKGHDAWRRTVPLIYEMFDEWKFEQEGSRYRYCTGFCWLASGALADGVYAVLSDTPVQPVLPSDRDWLGAKAAAAVETQRSLLVKALTPLAASPSGGGGSPAALRAISEGAHAPKLTRPSDVDKLGMALGRIRHASGRTRPFFPPIATHNRCIIGVALHGVYVWDCQGEEVVHTIKSPKTFNRVCAMHDGMIMVGALQSSVSLWRCVSERAWRMERIYHFRHGKRGRRGERGSARGG